MNRRRVGLAVVLVGAGAAAIRRRTRTQTDSGAVGGAVDSAANSGPHGIDAAETAGATDSTAPPAIVGSPTVGSPVIDAEISDPRIGSPDIALEPESAPKLAATADLMDSSPGDGPDAAVGATKVPTVGLDTRLGGPVLGGPVLGGPAPVGTAVGTTLTGSPVASAEAAGAQAVDVEPVRVATDEPGPDTLASVPAPILPPMVGAAATDAPATGVPSTASVLPRPSGFVPAADVEPPKPPRYQRRGWRIFGGLLIGLLVTAFIAASVIRLPYYSLSPGAVYDTIERVEAPGDLVSVPDGEIGFVTVAQTANITPWQWLDAKLDSNVRIRHEDEVQGNQTADELREADLRRMQISKNDAVIVALQRLGYDLEITPIGIEVAQVFDCTAADGTLGTGDLIIGVNGVDVRDQEQLVAQLGQAGIGEEIELLIERIDPNNPTQSMRTDLVGLTLGSADDACLPDDIRADEPRPFIGIGTQPLVDENFPIDVDVRTGRVSGPSAGLAFTLAIMDVLSEGELTNGLSIVATGTINREGQVGPVGGIHQKTVAAERSGADLFLVPLCCDNFVDSVTGEPLDLPSNYEEALLHADDMIVVGVENLDDALIAIGELGGDVDAFLNQ